MWRTPGRDGGRDIQGDNFVEDLSGHTRQESWYVECKQYGTTISWPVVWEKIAYAESNSADVLFFITTSTLSPQAIDEVNKWNLCGRRPHIRFWGGQDLHSRLQTHPKIQIKFGLSTDSVRDGAISIIPLTKLLLSYASTSEAQLAFSQDASDVNGAVHALAELISARLEDIEQTGKLCISKFRAREDTFEWLRNPELLEGLRLDRYSVRAILSILRFVLKTDITINGDLTKAFIDTKQRWHQTIISELETIAFWGLVRIQHDPKSGRIELS